MVFQITLQCYVILLGPAMDRHCRKFMLIKNPRNKFQFELELMSGNELEVMGGNEIEVMTEIEIDVMIGDMLDVMPGKEIDVMTGSEFDVTAGNKLDAMVGNMFRRISLFKKIGLHEMQRLKQRFKSMPGTGQHYL